MKRFFGVLASVAVVAACQQSTPAPLSGRWDVQQIAGASLGEGVDVWIEIDEATGAVSGFTGCNAFTTTASIFSAGVAFAPVQEAAGECPSMAAATDEARFLGVLPAVQRYIRRGRSLELLPSAQGSEALLRLRLSDTPAT
jgi:heat shock protein HslJ